MNLLAGVAAMLLCLLIQALAAIFVVRALFGPGRSGPWAAFRRLSGLMIVLVTVAIVQMAIWAGVYRLLGEFESFHEALYFSGVTFTSLGYGDVTLSQESRLLGPIEAANGLLMVGVSTAMFATAVQHWLKGLLPAKDTSGR